MAILQGAARSVILLDFLCLRLNDEIQIAAIAALDVHWHRGNLSSCRKPKIDARHATRDIIRNRRDFVVPLAQLRGALGFVLLRMSTVAVIRAVLAWLWLSGNMVIRVQM